MNFSDLISLCQPIDVSGPEPEELGALRLDSRRVAEKDLFIAIRGTQADGHQFIGDAVNRGASVVICEEKMAAASGVSILRVADTRSLAGPLAQALEGNPADEMKVIGVTGTNGKTTVATLTYQVLQKLGARAGLLGTVAKHIDDQVIDSKLTTADPVELASDMRQLVNAGNSHLVMEVSSHALDQKRVNGIQFDLAAFTNLSHEHLDYHNTLKDYASAKKMLFDSLDDRAAAVINGDDDQAVFMISDCPAHIITFSFNKVQDVECQILANSIEGLTIRIGKILIKSTLMGVFNAYNITEAYLICHLLGFDDDAIVGAVQEARGAPGRLERVGGGADDRLPTVLVDYAHTPDALKNVSKTLSDIKKDYQKLHLIFGCGGNRDKAKRPMMAAAAEPFADVITVTSDNPRDEDPESIIDETVAGFRNSSHVIRTADRKKAIEHAIRQADRNTIILIAGKGHETFQEIKGQRHDFDDRQVARAVLDSGNSNPESPGA